jgi:transposase-like protein/ribosomal protein L37AE/L43A
MNIKKPSSSYSLVLFQEEYGTDLQCREYLFKAKFSSEFVCEKCQNTDYSFVKRHKVYQCKKCHKQHSVIVGSIFENTKLPLNIWFLAMYLVSQHTTGMSATTLQKLTGVRKYDTAWNMLHKIRKVMGNRDAKYTLEGIIEFDDAYFGGNAPGKRGAGNKSNVMVAVSKTEEGKPKYISMKQTANIKTDTIDEAMRTKIDKENSTLKTDGLPSLLALKNKGYTIKKTVIGNPKRASEIFKWVHTAISNSKSTLEGVCHGVSKKHLQLYLDEFCYKFNRRYFGVNLFKRLLIASCDSLVVRKYEL